MEEKERYSLEEFDDIDWELAIVDNELGKSLTFEEIKNLLNLQGKENQKLCQQIVDLNKENNKLREFRDDILRVQAEPYQFYKKIQQLKQEVNDWKQRFNSSEKWNKTLLQNSATVSELKNDKIKQLKQSQKQFAVDKMTELYNLTDEIYHTNDMDKEWLLDWLKAEIWKLNQEIKKLKGEMCEKK